MVEKLGFLICLLIIGNFGGWNVHATQIKLHNNGYEGLLIAINPSVSESPQVIRKIKVRTITV